MAGLLWLRRGFLWWVLYFENLLQDPTATNGEKAGRDAFTRSLGVASGWLSTNLFNASAHSSPGFGAVASRLGLSHEQAEADVRAWLATVTGLLERMRAIQVELDMEDTRKSW